MTTETTDTHSPSPANTPLALKLTEGLGPLPAAKCNAGTAAFAHNADTQLWTEPEVRAMLAAESKTEQVVYRALVLACFGGNGARTAGEIRSAAAVLFGDDAVRAALERLRA